VGQSWFRRHAEYCIFWIGSSKFTSFVHDPDFRPPSSKTKGIIILAVLPSLDSMLSIEYHFNMTRFLPNSFRFFAAQIVEEIVAADVFLLAGRKDQFFISVYLFHFTGQKAKLQRTTTTAVATSNQGESHNCIKRIEEGLIAFTTVGHS
jgi:hypothetical protein